MTQTDEFVGKMAFRSNPARVKIAWKSSFVRSRPPGRANISMSMTLPKSGTLPGLMTLSKRMTYDRAQFCRFCGLYVQSRRDLTLFSPQ